VYPCVFVFQAVSRKIEREAESGKNDNTRANTTTESLGVRARAPANRHINRASGQLCMFV